MPTPGLDDIVVLERTRAFTHVGGGIHLGPWGTAVLEDNGIADVVRSRGVPYGSRSHYDSDGQVTAPDLCRIRDERFARLISKPDAFASEVTGILDLDA